MNESTNTTTQDLHHLAGAYALDAVTEEERRDFEAHFPTCAICSREVEEFRAVAARLADSTESVEPPAHLKSQIMAVIHRTPQLSPLPGGIADGPDRERSAEGHTPESPPAPRGRVIDLRSLTRPGQARMTILAAAAALVLIVGFGAMFVRGLGVSAADAVIAAPDARVTTLEGPDGSGTIQVVWSAERDQVVVFTPGVPTAGANRAYALWFVEPDGADGVAPAALFQAGAGPQVYDIDDLDPVAWGVTNEPAGGSTQPTGPVLYTGAI